MPELAEMTVVVPTRNEARNIAGFLDSLPVSLSLVVVDNSTDETPEIIRAVRPERTLTLHCPGSLTEARQIGARNAHTPWLLFTDADVVFADDYFERVAALEPVDVAYGPKLSRDRYRDYYRWFAHGQHVLDAIGIPAATGSNLLVRSAAFAAVGGFDLALSCNEDSELVWRVARAGYRCRFADELRVWAVDHRRLERGLLSKTAHTLTRCALLRYGLLPKRWRSHDWGYWSGTPDT